RVEKFAGAVAAAAGDEEGEKRVEAIAPTAEKLAAGQNVTGWPRLAELLNGDAAVVQKARGWLGVSAGGKGAGWGLVTRGLDDIPRDPGRWLVRGYLPQGKLVLVAGDGGHGKSPLLLGLAAALTRGRPAFGLPSPAGPPADVLLVSC